MVGEGESGAGKAAVDEVEANMAQASTEGAFEVFVVGERDVGQ